MTAFAGSDPFSVRT